MLESIAARHMDARPPGLQHHVARDVDPFASRQIRWPCGQHPEFLTFLLESKGESWCARQRWHNVCLHGYGWMNRIGWVDDIGVVILPWTPMLTSNV